MEINKCNICKLKAYIKCDWCDNSIFFCSRGHWYVHKTKNHRAVSTQSFSNPPNKRQNNQVTSNNDIYDSNQNQNYDMKKIYESLQNSKQEILEKMNHRRYPEAIEQINKSLSLSRKFFEEDNTYNIELLYALSECYLNVSNLEYARNNLDSIVMLTENIPVANTNSVLRYKANMLWGAISLNLGEFNSALKAYTLCEKELPLICQEPEWNVKLSAVYLNWGICYIYLSNPNIAEKYLNKGLSQTQGIWGNDTIHKLNADWYENWGVWYEQNLKFKEALVYYKKALKIKFSWYGENNDEVLELQYKISSVYLSLKQYKESEEILTSLTDVILKEKMNNATQETIYRYSAYFYTLGVIFIKTNKANMARFYLEKSKDILNSLLINEDPLLSNIAHLIKVCDRAKR